jgi:hypothetical protein
MSAADDPDRPTESREERRRRLAAVFGDVLPEQTSDDAAEPDARGGRETDRGEEWLRRQVPPHHG